jgi:hypothetical protein
MTEAPEQSPPPAGGLPDDLPWRLEPGAVLAASAPWLGAVLNVLPGLGTGYIYQRRWRAYWTASLLAAAWILLGGRLLSLMPSRLEEGQAGLIGTAGLLALALVTALEAFLTARKARQTDG